MDILVAAGILVAVGVVGLVVYRRLAKGWAARRIGLAIQRQLDPGRSAPVREPTVETLRPGDVVSLEDGRDLIVETVLECREEVGGRTTVWRWNFLSDGLMLEAAPDGNVLYDRTEVIYQGEEAFQRLVADGGVLKSFEERVRAGTAGARPVSFHHGGHVYRVRSTGTFVASPAGTPLGDEVWRDISPRQEDNVYFEMEGKDGEQVLGVWTTHIALLYGQPLGRTDIRTIYPGADP